MSKHSQRLTARIQERQMQQLAQKELKQYYKENTLWDDLEAIYVECRTMIVNTMDSVRVILADKPLLALIDPNQHVNFNNSVRSIVKDNEQFTTELLSIHARHEMNKGAARDADQVSTGQLISADYLAFSTRYKAVVDPVFAYIMEEAAKAEGRLKDAVEQGIALAQQDQAADISVVTDVVAKEVQQ